MTTAMLIPIGRDFFVQDLSFFYFFNFLVMAAKITRQAITNPLTITITGITHSGLARAPSTP